MLSLLLASCVRYYGSGPKDDGAQQDRDRGAQDPDHGPPPDLVPPDSLPVPEAGCPTGLTQCGAVCADLTGDAKHCGACNKSCDDKDQCSIDTCVAGVCKHPYVSDGTPCDDGKKCTTGDACEDGDCEGNYKDCSHLDSGQCIVGRCDETSGACEAADKKNGWPCNDGKYCTAIDVCLNGTCTSGLPRKCETDCKTGTCDEQADQCVTSNKVDGTTCDDGKGCTDGDACSGGVCIGTPVPTGTSCGTSGGHCCGEKCCSSYESVCCAATSSCCPMGNTCCGAKCCYSGQKCCNNTTCCSGSCCGSKCCYSGQKCCNTTTCCSGVCCGTKCCSIGSSCCGTSCCSTGSTCCSDNKTCCTIGTTCCGNQCCSMMQQCCPDKTCKTSCS